MEPTSIAPERINKFHKTVLRPERSRLSTERAVKALFVYANLRFLNNVSYEREELWECFERCDSEVVLAEALAVERSQLMEGLPDPSMLDSYDMPTRPAKLLRLTIT